MAETSEEMSFDPHTQQDDQPRPSEVNTKTWPDLLASGGYPGGTGMDREAALQALREP